jgi:hypothetical protein
MLQKVETRPGNRGVISTSGPDLCDFVPADPDFDPDLCDLCENNKYGSESHFRSGSDLYLSRL